LRNLRELSIGDMPWTEDAMLALSRIESLEYLTLYRIQVTDRGVQALSNLTHLKCLHLQGCEGITSEQLDKLKASLPGDFELETY
jgi:hypothetical protein